MPRTKQVRRKSDRELTEESESLVRDFERLADQRIHKLEADMKMQISSLSNFIDVAISRLPAEMLRMTLNELITVDLLEDNDGDINSETNSPPMSPVLSSNIKYKKKIPTKRTTTASDDGYATECTTRTTHVSRINTTRNSNSRQQRISRSSSSNRNSARPVRSTRSTSRTDSTSSSIASKGHSNRNNLLTVPSGPPRTASKFKTPAAKNQASSFAVVTPKFKPNTPMNILRRPREGEMVLSMQGSPLLVSSIIQERTANINVPLSNGNVISLLPNAGLRLSHMPAVDADTMDQLKTLKSHIDMVIQRQ